MKIFKKFRDFELHHKMILFIMIIVVTILITRVIVQFYNPNPQISGFELHHFDYGLIGLILSIILMLFGKKHDLLYLIMSSISLGLVIDNFWFVRKMVVEQDNVQMTIYNSTLLVSIVILVVISFIILLVDKMNGKKEGKSRRDIGR